jgi:hypothetical protein
LCLFVCLLLFVFLCSVSLSPSLSCFVANETFRMLAFDEGFKKKTRFNYCWRCQ